MAGFHRSLSVGPQALDLQKDALRAFGIAEHNVYEGVEKHVSLQNAVEPLIHTVGIISIIFGAIKAWQQKSIRPFLFLGCIGMAIAIVF